MVKTAFCAWVTRGGAHCIDSIATGNNDYLAKRHGGIIKTLLVMKLTVLLLTAICLNVAAKGVAQDVTFSGKNISLEEIFSVIERQTGYLFLYQEKTLADAKPVTVEAKKEPLLKFLEAIFNNQPLQYSISSKTINVSSGPAAGHRPTLPGTVDLFYTPPIRGRVLGPDGNPLAGATVKTKNSKLSQATDAKGEFSINAKAGEILIVSYVGFTDAEVSVSSNTNEDIIITLSRSNSPLDEVQVIAYGTRIRRLNTGNVTTVKSSEIQDIPVSNPMVALQGRIPGLEITPNNGLSGSGVKLRIQGINSLENGADPLIIVDNVPYPSQRGTVGFGGSFEVSGILGRNGGGGTAASINGSPLNFINAADIESVEVLKGADATSIYGSRGANGVILITTKKGKPGKTSISVNLQTGIKKVGKELKVMDSRQYLEMRREALKNDGIQSPPPTAYDLNGAWDTTVSHNWQKELAGKSALNTLGNISINGGNDNNSFLISGQYSSEEHVYSSPFKSQDDTRGALHIALNSRTPDKKLSISFSSAYLYDKNKLPMVDYMPKAIMLAPVAPDLLTKDGMINWQLNASGNETFVNPIAASLQTYSIESLNLIGAFNIGYEIMPDLKITTDIGYNRLSSEEMGTLPAAAIQPSYRSYGDLPTMQNMYRVTQTYNIDPRITYNHSFTNTKVEMLLGSTMTCMSSIGRGYTAQGFSNDLLIEDIASADQLLYPLSAKTIYRYNSVYGRINYALKNKYVVQFNTRRDGSSRFGPDNRFHTFWSVAGAWIFTDEDIIREKLPFLSFGKLRSSYGTTGNDQLDDYTFLTLYAPYNTVAGRAYQGVSGLKPTRLSNPSLQWEESRKFEIALELGFVKDRILLNTNFALNHSSNQLIGYSLPITAGFGNIQMNFPAKVQNRSWEFSLTTTNIKTRNFTWQSLFTLTLPENKLVSFPGIEETGYFYSLVPGMPLYISKVYRFAGVNKSTGIFEFYNSKGETTSNPQYEDMVPVSTMAEYFGGFYNTFNYKRLNLKIGFNFNKQNVHVPLPGVPAGFFNMNFPEYFTDRWQKEGDVSAYQRYSSSFTDATIPYTYYAVYKNTYFIRCNSIALSYTIAGAWRRKMGINDFIVYTQILNPFVLTNNKLMLDPQTGNGLPPLKTLNVGLKISF